MLSTVIHCRYALIGVNSTLKIENLNSSFDWEGNGKKPFPSSPKPEEKGPDSC